MALRNQPYIPLYVDDVLSDEKLRMCSPEAHGIYLLMLCVLHKQEVYGKLLLKQKYKQSKNKFHNFALYFVKQMPFEAKQIEAGLIELSEEGVIEVTEDMMFQKRMVRDGSASLSKSEYGKLGGTHSARQYGKPGQLFWMSDYGNKQKIGTSVNSQNRLYRIRSDYKLKTFDIIQEFAVEDMGACEDLAANFFKDKLDGEFINLSYQEMTKKFVLLQAEIQANKEQISVNAIVNANEDTNISTVGNITNSNSEIALLEAKDEQSKDHNQNDESEVIKRRYENFKKFLLGNQIWCEEVCMKTRSKLEDLPKMIDNFISHCIFGGETHHSEKDFQSHFRNVCLSRIDIVKPRLNGHSKESIESRMEAFRQKVLLYKNQYDKEILESFFIHWAEPDEVSNLLRLEMEKVFDIPTRLAKWKMTDKKISKNGSATKHSGTDYAEAARKMWG